MINNLYKCNFENVTKNRYNYLDIQRWLKSLERFDMVQVDVRHARALTRTDITCYTSFYRRYCLIRFTLKRDITRYNWDKYIYANISVQVMKERSKQIVRWLPFQIVIRAVFNKYLQYIVTIWIIIEMNTYSNHRAVVA